MPKAERQENSISPACWNELATYVKSGDPRDDIPGINDRFTVPLIEKYGKDAITGGFIGVVERLRWLYSTKPQILPDELARVTAGYTFLMFDLVAAAKENGPKWLMSFIFDGLVVHGYDDEDPVTLAAYVFASEQLKKEPAMNAELIMSYRRAVGTGCKMALAYALFSYGNRRFLKRFVETEHFAQSDYYKELENKLRSEGHSEENIEYSLLLEFAVPERIHGFPIEGSLIGLLGADIASQGKRVVSRSRDVLWTRK